MKTKQISGKREMFLMSEGEAPTKSYTSGLHIMHKGNVYAYLCTLSEITEEQAAELVDKFQGSDLRYKNYCYREQNGGQRVGAVFHAFCRNAHDSFFSLLESAGVLFENPEEHNELKELLNIPEKALTTYQMYEANVFRPGSTLVFVKQ